MLYDAGGRTVAVLVPGDREVEEAKLERVLFPAPVRPFDEDDFRARGFVRGYRPTRTRRRGNDSGRPLRSRRRRLGDRGERGGPPRHRREHAARRIDQFEDLVALRDGDRCPVDGGQLHIGRSIVVGHIYQLGTRFSGPSERRSSTRTVRTVRIVGSHGIGISRILAAAAEQFHDDQGLRLPKALAVRGRGDQREHRRRPRRRRDGRIYDELLSRGVDVVVDDRGERAGVKFADADLVGYPVHIVVGSRGVAAGTADLKLRATGDRSQASLTDAAEAAVALLSSAP